MTSDTAQHCYVYITLPGQTAPVTAGRYTLASTRLGEAQGSFVYGRSYLGRADAVPLDPVELPLSNRSYTTQALGGVADEDVPADAAHEQVDNLLLLGTSMGGARPKAVVEDESGLWIAKFNRPDDPWNSARVEHATPKVPGYCWSARLHRPWLTKWSSRCKACGMLQPVMQACQHTIAKKSRQRLFTQGFGIDCNRWLASRCRCPSTLSRHLRRKDSNTGQFRMTSIR